MNIVKEVQEKLKQEINAAVIKAGLATEEQVPNVVLELPRDKTHGDYSTNMAMQLARVAKKAPRMIAEELINHFDQSKASNIAFQDFFLGVIHLDAHGVQRFGDFSLPCFVMGEEEVPGVLLGDGACPLHLAHRLQVGKCCASHPFEIEPIVLIEPFILDRDRRFDQIGRDVIKVDPVSLFSCIRFSDHRPCVQLLEECSGGLGWGRTLYFGVNEHGKEHQ